MSAQPEQRDPSRFAWEHAGLEVRPATAERWSDFQTLFGDRGACGGCWCMWFRVSRRRFETQKGDANKLAMQSLFQGDEPPGLIAYRDEDPVGWVSVSPREAYPRLEGSRVAKRVDGESVWSVVCLFIDKNARSEGVATSLLRAAAAWVAHRGGALVEGYAVDPGHRRLPDVFAFHGPAAAFRAAGYDEIDRPTEKRAVFRREAGFDF